jgi:hypothetical protein
MHYAAGFKKFQGKSGSPVKPIRKTKQMIIRTDKGQPIDTADLSPEERHVIQKLLAWMTLVDSVDQFRQKIHQALAAGWNDSGPIRETRALTRIVQHLEKQVRKRLKTPSGRGSVKC